MAKEDTYRRIFLNKICMKAADYYTKNLLALQFFYKRSYVKPRINYLLWYMQIKILKVYL